MIEQEKDGVRYVTFESLAAQQGLDALVTTRHGGVIAGPVATPAGHILLPTHREVMTAAFGLPLWVIAPEGLPRLPCV